MKNSNMPKGDLFADKMDVDLNMLRAPMLNWVGGHVDGTEIVVVNNGHGSNWDIFRFITEGSLPLGEPVTSVS